MKFLLVRKIEYATFALTNSSKRQNGLPYGIHDPNVEDSSILPNKRICQGSSYQARGVATKLVDVVKHCAYIICFLKLKYCQELVYIELVNIRRQAMTYLLSVCPFEDGNQIDSQDCCKQKIPVKFSIMYLYH